MENLLKPERLAIEPSSIGAEGKWKHWKKAFTNYLAQTPAKTDEDRLKILFNNVTTSIFVYISECEKYDIAINILDSLYLMRMMSVSLNMRQSFARKTQTGNADGADHIMILKLKSAEDNLNNKMVEIAQLKKKLTENATLIKKEQNALRMMETKKIAITHKVTISQGQIDDLKEEKKLMVNLVEELRAELALKESAITHRDIALRKIQTQKDSLQEDVQRWQDANKESRKAVNLLQENLKDARNFLKEQKFDIERLTLENKHRTTERDIAKQQLIKVKDENKRLNSKCKSLQKSLNTEKARYSERLDEIRLLKLDYDSLRKEKCKLIKIIENTADHQSTIYNLEKDLLKERLKASTLEEELQKPINIHRWRKLEGTNPSQMELQLKNNILQKRLLKEVSQNLDKREKLMLNEIKCEELKEKLNSEQENNPNLTQKLFTVQNDLRKRGVSLKLQKTKVNCLVSQNAKLKLKLDIALKKLSDMDRLQREQKNGVFINSSNDTSGKIEQKVEIYDDVPFVI